jgi:hypothetical protein
MWNKEYIIGLLLIFIFASCEKEEIPLDYMPPEQAASEFTDQVSMGADYRYRLYYDLESDSVIAFHEKRDWDLAFSTSGDGLIRLNTSKFMSVYKTGSTDIATQVNFQGNGPKYDTSDGAEEGTAIGTLEAGRVYIVDRGYDETGAALGFVRFSFESISSDSYLINYGPLGQSSFAEATVPRDNSVNQVMFSFDTGVEFLEPPKETWDLLFTHYTYYFVNEDLQYLVSGALLNPYQVTAAKVSDQSYAAMDLGIASSYEFKSESDVIGYDWKAFDLENGTYNVMDNLYLIQTSEANVYKFSFTGFYDPTGAQGAPIFKATLLQ